MSRSIAVWILAYIGALAAGIAAFSIPLTIVSGVPVGIALRDQAELLSALVPRVGIMLILPAIVLFMLGARGRGAGAYAVCGALLPVLFVLGSEVLSPGGDLVSTLSVLPLLTLPGAVAGFVFYLIWTGLVREAEA